MANHAIPATIPTMPSPPPSPPLSPQLRELPQSAANAATLRPRYTAHPSVAARRARALEQGPATYVILPQGASQATAATTTSADTTATAGERTGTVTKPARNEAVAAAAHSEIDTPATAAVRSRVRAEDAAPAVGVQDEDVAAVAAGERTGTVPKPAQDEAATATARPPPHTAYSGVKSVPAWARSASWRD